MVIDRLTGEHNPGTNRDYHLGLLHKIDFLSARFVRFR